MTNFAYTVQWPEQKKIQPIIRMDQWGFFLMYLLSPSLQRYVERTLKSCLENTSDYGPGINIVVVHRIQKILSGKICSFHNLMAELYCPFLFLLTLRNRFDFRFKEEIFSSRYRPRLMLERDFHTEYLFFTISTFLEYYANFGEANLNRFRYQLGFEFKITRHIAYESFWNHQFPNEPNVGSVNAFGMTVKFYLQQKEKEGVKE